ncbi:conserved protein of unknown function [Limnospira indica PCC 8005]|uniref:Uncharacterized protein n=1 Tax=Limnospira indica PCC 8005 TaxID=376219 RepID=A0A9P1KBP7_9CYAN|nr:conserved protein of unknown function [Limnospira indica PCC 8005]
MRWLRLFIIGYGGILSKIWDLGQFQANLTQEISGPGQVWQKLG